MPALRINHVSVSSPDQDASGRFYSELFGVGAHPGAELRLPGRLVRASATPSCTSSRRTTRRRSGITSASPSTTSSRSTRRARELGVHRSRSSPTACACSRTATVQFYLRDPGGNLVEINGPVGDYTTDDIPELKPLDGAAPPGARDRGRPALPVNIPLGGAMTAPPELLTPTSPAEAAAAFGDGAGVTVMGGGTILLPELTYGRLRPDARADARAAPGSAASTARTVRVRIGAATPVGELAGRARAARDRRRGTSPTARSARSARSAATSARRRATSAPRGDLQAPLLALGARITSAGAGGETTEDVSEFLEQRHRPARALDRRARRAARSATRASTGRTRTTTRCSRLTAVTGADGVRVAASGVARPRAAPVRGRVGAGRRRVGRRRLGARGRRPGPADRRARVGLVPGADAAAARAARARTAGLKGRMRMPINLTVNGVAGRDPLRRPHAAPARPARGAPHHVAEGRLRAGRLRCLHRARRRRAAARLPDAAGGRRGRRGDHARGALGRRRPRADPAGVLRPLRRRSAASARRA